MSVADPTDDVTPSTPAQTGDDVSERRRWLDSFLKSTRAEQNELARRESRASWLRLVIFLIGLAVWIALNALPLIALGLTAIVVAAFVVAVRRHASLKESREELDRLVAACEDAERRLGGAVVCIRSHAPPDDPAPESNDLPRIADDGECWTLSDQERGDLDLFTPPVGIYGLLNRTSTDIGARRLSEALTQPMLDGEHILRRQRSVRLLCDAPEQRLRMIAACMALRDEDRRLAALINAVSHAAPLRLFAPTGALRAWSLASAALILGICAATAGGVLSWLWLAPPLLINAVIYFAIRPALVENLHAWRDVSWALRGLLITARCARRNLPEDPQLTTLRERFAAVTPHDVLGGLMRRLGWAESGGMLQGLLNLVVLCDLHTAQSILKRVVPNRDAILESIAAVAELELHLSLAAFAWEQPAACWPEPCAETRIDIRAGRHPLVDPERVVPNDLLLDERTRLWIVTGSNMAGKSTFLRMSAVNTLLAQIGTVALASEMTWRPVRLLTDLRAADNIALNESYFLAEVRHLRRLIVSDAHPAPVFGLIDEPFRGTNSQDQSAASVAVVRHL
ncbi:MAG: hypothetical protein D6744_07315, partial [Planctomycetota bacterium]